MQIAKSYPATGETVIALKRMAEKLPKIHYLTLAFLMHHLKRISELSYENNMPASNLGIVFAPTLLRSRSVFAPINSYVSVIEFEFSQYAVIRSVRAISCRSSALFGHKQ